MGVNIPSNIIVRVPKGTPGATQIADGGYGRIIGLDEVSRTPMNRFAGYMDNIVGARIQVYYDTIVLVAGTNLVQGAKVSLFKEGLEDDGKIWNTGAAFTKTRIHTNMVEDGQFEYGVTVIVVAFELLFLAPPAAATTYSNGVVTNAADAGAQPAGYNNSQYARALMLQNGYVFRRGSDISEENGKLIDLPSNVGLSGSFGAQANTAIVQNSLGSQSARMLEYPKVLHSKENFQIDIEALASTFPIPIDTTMEFRMIGKRLKSTS